MAIPKSKMAEIIELETKYFKPASLDSTLVRLNEAKIKNPSA